MKKGRLPSEIRDLIDYSLSKRSRVHRLPSAPQGRFWIKREDELSSGISGSKLRKYASLIPALKRKGVEMVGMIGGPNSNNLVGLAQLLKENSIEPVAFIRKAADPILRGNALLLDMLLPAERIRNIARADWQNAETIAKNYLEKLPREKGGGELLLEGCFGFDALPGAMSMAEDIVRNEKESETEYETIYVDCGTGLTAIGLILGLDVLSRHTQAPTRREIVVTLIAETQERFQSKLAELRSALSSMLGYRILPKVRIRYLLSIVAPKFGAVNRTLFQSCREISRDEGLLMDPTYSVKHFVTARDDFAKNRENSNSLFIFNGSPLGIAGFQDRLADPDL